MVCRSLVRALSRSSSAHSVSIWLLNRTKISSQYAVSTEPVQCRYQNRVHRVNRKTASRRQFVCFAAGQVPAFSSSSLAAVVASIFTLSVMLSSSVSFSISELISDCKQPYISDRPPVLKSYGVVHGRCSNWAVGSAAIHLSEPTMLAIPQPWPSCERLCALLWHDTIAEHQARPGRC